MTTSAPDWDALHNEAVDLLCDYLRIDTSNPPGNERLACDFIGAVLDREGIPYELFDAGGDRVSLRAVLRGDGSKRAFMLLNHTDVVPVQREFWDEEPFSGLIKDGFIWGRGALDMKGLGIVQLMTFLTLKRFNIPLARDVVFFAMADEEAGSEFGVRWLERNHPDSLDAEFIINEGGGGITEIFGVERPVFSIAVAEKGPVWLRLVAEGTPGHGSVPHDNNAVNRLTRALFAVQHWDRPLDVSPALQEYFGRLSRAGIYQGDPTPDGLQQEAEKNPLVRALLSNTISPTSLSAGVKVNVIPAKAEATLDCRLLPGVKPEAFIEELAAVINDDKVKIERIHTGWSETNSFDTELFRVIEEVIHDHMEEAVVVPGMTVGFTDSSTLRNRGQVSYGFSGGLSTPELGRTVHGHNERVSLESLRLNCQVVYEVVRRMCAAEVPGNR